MSIKECLLGKGRTAGSGIDQERAQEFVRRIERAEFAGEGQDEQTAARSVLDAATRETDLRRRRSLLQLARQLQIRDRILSVPPDKAGQAALSVLHFDETGEFAGDSVYLRAQAIENQVFGQMAEFFQEFRPRAAGLPDLAASVGRLPESAAQLARQPELAGRLRERTQARAAQREERTGMRRVVRELFGESTGDTRAREIAQAIGGALNGLRERANLAGMNIGRLENFGLPQTHDRVAVAQDTAEEWRRFITPLLDHSRLLNSRTGQPLTGDELAQSLLQTRTQIVTDGLVDVQPGVNFAVRRSINTRRAESRELHFKSADAWLAYQQRYGSPDIFTHLVNHVRGLANDVGAMEIMGPNPDATMDFIKQTVTARQNIGAAAAEGRGARPLLGRDFDGKLERLYAVVTKSHLTTENEFWANFFGGVRNLRISVLLGSAFLSSITDVGFSALTSGYNRLNPFRVLGRQLRTFSTASVQDRKLALQAGITVDAWTSALGAQQRFMSDNIGPELTQRLADTVMRASFLTPWTDAGRIAFGHEFLFHTTSLRGTALADMQPAVRQRFERVGISADEWDLIRGVEPFRDPDSDVEMLRPQDVINGQPLGANDPRGNQDLASKYHAMLLLETQFAVPSTTGKAAVATTAGAQRGSWVGEVFRNLGLFKSFPVTVFLMHLRGRGYANAERALGARGLYLGGMIASTGIMGALALQLRDVAAGKDPRPMTGSRFWGAAIMQGGGLGIMGDFLFSDVNRFGGGIYTAIAGPVVGQAADVLRLTVGNIEELIQDGEARNAGPELIRFIRGLTPGGNIWYTRLALERGVWDFLLQQSDPDYSARFRRMIRRSERDMGQSFFARPGGGFPQRAPDLSNIAEPER